MVQVPLGRWSVTLAALTLALVMLADWLFYGHVIGWTAAVFLLAVMAAVVIRQGRIASSRPAWILVALLVGLAGAMVVAPGMLALLLSMVGVGAWVFSERLGWTVSMRQWASRAIGGAMWTLWQPIHDSRTQHRWRKRHGTPNIAFAVMGNWLVPVLLTGVFVLLFRAANPVMGQWIDEAGAHLTAAVQRLDELLATARVTLWLLAGIVAWSLLRNRPTTQRPDRFDPPLPPIERAPWLDRFVTTPLVVRCLILFNTLFALQTVMDVYYLWGGGALPTGMSYAEYAHRGAYPLVATALLAGLFVLLSFRPGGPAEQSVWARRLVYLWIVQNIFLVTSAGWRLQLYVEVYSLTRWRVAAAVWMLLVVLGLVWIVWRIVRQRDNAWLLRVNVVTAGAVLYICAFVNFDGFIANHNVQRAAEVTGEGVSIDLDYLAHLGVEALPAVAWLEDQLTEHERASDVQQTRQALEQTLHDQLADWRGWTLRRHQLARSFPAAP